MKKIFTTSPPSLKLRRAGLLLLAVGIITTGCGQEEIENCEELNVDTCSQYEEQCKICPDFINSPYENCHDITFCRNFENLDNN